MAESPGPDTSLPGEAEQDGPLAWCLVANVAEADRFRSGVRHFAVGAKVWIVPPQWGDGGEKVMVLGRRRGSRGRQWCRVVQPVDRFTDFRARPVYSADVWRQLVKPWRSLHGGAPVPVRFWWTRELAQLNNSGNTSRIV